MTVIARTIIVACTFVLGACATSEPGWTGNGAIPFGQAEEACLARSTGSPDQAARAAYEACMRDHGWTRRPT